MPKYLIFCFLFVFSCSATQNTEEAGPVEKQKTKPEIGFKNLVVEAQQLRDLEFTNAPKLVHVDKIIEGLPLEIVSEYTVLKDVFDIDLSRSPSAIFDKEKNAINYVSQFSQKKDEHAIFRALIAALDSEKKDAIRAPQSVDQFLALEVRRLSSGAFLSVLKELKTDAPQLSSERIARRPQSWMKSEIVASDLVSKFSFRNALVFGATMYRSNRIPGLEYGLSNGPQDSGSIKRPDRWLAGEGVGKWTLPKAEVPTGYGMVQEGTLGPLFLEKWLGANPALSFWMSGSYRVFKSDEKWLFEWVSMWETPTAASVAGKMLTEGFERQKKKDVVFSVIEFGNVVSVVGTFSGEQTNGDRAQVLASQSQVIFLSEEKPFLNFVPTSFERLQTLKPQRKGLSAPGVIFDDALLEAWNVETPKTGLWWYATLGNTAIIQCNVELMSLDSLGLGAADYGEKWLRIFQSSVGDVDDAKVSKLDWNGVPAWEIDMQGKRSEADVLRRIISRQYAIGEYIVSVSLVSDPKDESSVQTLKKLVESAKFTP